MIFRADTLLCDSLQEAIAKADTLPLFYQDQFASKDSTQLTEYYSQQELSSGLDGIPIPYSPRTDNGMALVLLACFFLSSFALARSKKFLLQQVKDFLLHRERTSIFTTTTAADMRYLLLLVLQTCTLGGICIFNYFSDVSPMLMERVSPHLLLGLYTVACLGLFVFKWLLYSFLGWVFLDKNRTDIWLESYSVLIYYLGFALFPFVLFLVYFDLNVDFLISIGLVLVIFTKILMFYKWIKLFFNNINRLFLLILYFCALEIIPCLLVCRGVMELNNIWK